MFAKRSAGTTRSLLAINAFLLSTAFALPAFAQVEEVVVTAERKSENIQDVPIQVSAFSAEDLAAHQITMAKDLQFATPNVTYTKTNFSGDDFSIRGIGNDVITGGGESGVSVSFDNIYLSGAGLDLSSFYDVERVEVLEGPQSTLYGRGAAAGSVNIIPIKPDLETFSASADASYGNYSQNEDHAMINIPIITDQLGARFAFDREYNGGIISNVYDDGHIDGNNTYSARGSLRWQPTSNTTIDFVFQDFNKDDSTMRAQRQQCDFDPSGTLGCLGNGVGNSAINVNAFFSADIASQQGLESAFAGTPLAALAPFLGLVNLQTPALQQNQPSKAFTVDTDFNPTWRAHDDFMAINWKQHLVSWLDFEANLGYDHGSTVSQESYNNAPNAPIAPPDVGGLGTFGPAVEGSTVLGTLYDVLAFTPVVGSPAYAANFAQYFSHTNGLGQVLLPAAGFTGLGLSTNTVKYYTNTYSTFDQSNAEQTQYSLDMRFTSSLKGPVNFMVGAFYLRQQGWGDYFVSSGSSGYTSVALGALSGLGVGACDPTPGCLLDPAYYDNSSPQGGVTLKSQSLYGEVYWDIMPDLLKLTIGGRFTDDYKSQEDRILLVNSLFPIGTSSFPTSPSVPGAVPYQFQSQTYINWSGRAVLDYTPKLDFTDQTLVYASASRGYKAGGFNPGLSTFAMGQGVSSTYAPEGIDALELGTKNDLLHNTLQANFDVWFYNYEGLQISQILDNDSINANINSHMYGSEGQLVYVPDDHWAFNFNVGYTHSSIGNSYLVDPRNPTAGAANAVLIKDATATSSAAQNCAVYLTTATVAPGNNATLTAAFAAAEAAYELAHSGTPDPNLASNPYFAPPGGSGALATYGIPLTNYGSCNPAFFTDPNVITVMNANGYSYSLGPNQTAGGVAENLHGNQNPNSPPWTLSAGAQYTFNFGAYSLVPRVDVDWQTDMWGRVFEDPADKIKSFFVTNVQVQLNSPDSMWYLQVYAKNLFNKTYVTGEYLTSSSSGLYTNDFLGDPRMFGVRAGIKF
jgi:outer membrane receptor protein involved in Fe transport